MRFLNLTFDQNDQSRKTTLNTTGIMRIDKKSVVS